MGPALPPETPPPPPPPGASARLADLDLGTRVQVRRTMRLSVLEGSLTQVFLNWTSGSVLVGFMLHLGASPTELALVSSVPFLSQLASPAAAYLAAALGRRRALIVVMALASRLTWLLAAALPLVPLPDPWRPPLLIAVVLVSSFFLAANSTVWTAWMGDVVPERERGAYFGLRAGVVGVVGMAANLAAGAFLDRVGAPLSFQVVLLVSIATALVGVAVYALQIDPPTPHERVPWRHVLTLPWRDLAFRRFLRFALYWQFAILIGSPFVLPYYLTDLGLTFSQVAIASSITAIVGLATTSLWGRLADRIGHKAVAGLGTFLVGLLLPSTWILAGLLDDIRWVWVSAVADAIGWGAAGPAIFNLALLTAPRTQRVVFIAMYSLGTGVAGFVGGALSGPLLVLLQGTQGVLFGAAWSGYHSLFLLSGLLRMTAWLWLLPVPARRWSAEEPAAGPLAEPPAEPPARPDAGPPPARGR
jgi:MFS family permease